MNRFNILGKTFTEGVWSKIKAVATAKPEDRLATLAGTTKPSSVVAGSVGTLTKGAKAVKQVIDDNK